MFGRKHHPGHEHPGRRFARGEWFGGRHGGGGGRFEHMRGGRGRVFDQGDLRYVILQLIAEKPRYGYEIIKAIEEKLAGSYSPSPGVIYPTLTMLEELGYASVNPTEGGKKLYAITPEGAATLEANKAVVDAIFARMEEVSAAHGGGPAPQILRAAQNLRMALKMRLGRGPMSEEQVQAIVTVLDAAAVAVERS
jgi:DNA-binding PadR family transcriptional regulator